MLKLIKTIDFAFNVLTLEKDLSQNCDLPFFGNSDNFCALLYVGSNGFLSLGLLDSMVRNEISFIFMIYHTHINLSVIFSRTQLL